jgi:hypothetical protein
MKTVRALTRGMKFVRDNPAETRRIARAHFSISMKRRSTKPTRAPEGHSGIPVLTPEQYQQTLKAYFFGTKTQLTVPYEKAVASDFARQAQRDISAASRG